MPAIAHRTVAGALTPVTPAPVPQTAATPVTPLRSRRRRC